LVLFAISVATNGLRARQAEPAQEFAKRRGLILLGREKWFYEQRQYPLGYIPAGARLKAFHQLQQMVRAINGRGSSSPAANLASPAQFATAANSIALSQTTWTLIGPQPTLPPANNPFTGYPSVAGRVTALAFDSRDITNKTIYLGSAEGGLWVTVNGGQTWTALTDSQPSLAVGSIALNSTTNPTTIYIGTGEENFNLDAYYGAGVLKSTDGGKTWTQDQTFSQTAAKGQLASGPYIGSVVIAPNNTQVLLAGVDGFRSNVASGVWRSSDAGTTWSQVLSLSDPHFPNGSPATAVVFDSSSPGVAYAALGDRFGNSTDGVYKSTDNGATWTPLTTLGIGPGLGRITLAVGPPASSGAPGELLVAIADATNCPTNPAACSTNLLGLFLSKDGGTTWTKLSNAPNFCGNPQNPGNGQCWYDMAIAIDPQIPTIFYAGGNNQDPPFDDTLIVSSDGGNTWSADLYAGNNGSTVNTVGQLHTDTHAIAFSSDGTTLAVGNDGGIWTTSSVGVSSNITWNDLNSPLAITQFYPGISIVPGNPNQGLGGTQDNGTQVYTGNLEWQQIARCGDGGPTAVTPNGATIYLACAANEGLFSASSAGAAWAGNGIGSCTSAPSANCYTASFAPPLAMDFKNPLVLYFGAQAPSGGPAQALYQTTNGASSWTAIAPNLGNFSIVTISVAPTDSNTVYVGTEIGTVFVTRNAGAGSGAVFQELDNGLPNRVITQVTVDPTTPTTAYASFSGFSSCSACDGKGHIFETTNGGTSWASITGGLPDIPVNALVVDPVIANTIYAATDVGSFVTADGGNTWAPLVTGLPNVAVLGLTVDPSTRTLWAGTHGRSMWALQLPQLPTATPSPASLTFANQNVGSTSAAQTVTLSNTGGLALSISSMSVASPFSQTNTCGSSIAAGANCSVSITFSPTVVGNASGTLSITDNLRSSPQTMALSGAGQDFAISSSPTSASLTPGSFASYTMTIAPQGGVGFSNPVSLACSAGLPSLASCSFSPASVTAGSSSATSTLTILTTAPSLVFPLVELQIPNTPMVVLWLVLLFVLAGLAVFARSLENKRCFVFATSALLICFVTPLLSCGGGSSGPRNPGTPAGTYSVTVTGTSNQLQHSTTATLTVQ